MFSVRSVLASAHIVCLTVRSLGKSICGALQAYTGSEGKKSNKIKKKNNNSRYHIDRVFRKRPAILIF